MNLRNTMLGTTGHEFEFLFIDYSHALGWTDSSYGTFDKVNVPMPLSSMLDRTSAEAAAAKIEQLDDAAITEIVQRIQIGLQTQRHANCCLTDCWHENDLYSQLFPCGILEDGGDPK